MEHVKTTDPYKFGLALGLDEYQLDIIKKDHKGDHSEQLQEVLRFYRRERAKPSWPEVAKALHSVEKACAERIAQKFGID